MPFEPTPDQRVGAERLDPAWVKTKVCTKCGDEKPIDDFYRDRNSKDGRRHRCRECETEYSVKYKDKRKEYYIKNKKRINQKNSDYYHEDKERSQSQRSNYYLKNKDTVKKKTKEYYLNNLEQVKKTKQLYYQRNKERLSKYKANWHKQKKDDFNAAIYHYFGDTGCYICGWQDECYEIYDCHHVDPIGKLHAISNMVHREWDTQVIPELEKCVLLCAPCHRKLTRGRFDEKIQSGELVLVPGRRNQCI